MIKSWPSRHSHLYSPFLLDIYSARGVVVSVLVVRFALNLLLALLLQPLSPLHVLLLFLKRFLRLRLVFGERGG